MERYRFIKFGMAEAMAVELMIKRIQEDMTPCTAVYSCDHCPIGSKNNLDGLKCGDNKMLSYSNIFISKGKILQDLLNVYHMYFWKVNEE